jgi:MFS family permease
MPEMRLVNLVALTGFSGYAALLSVAPLWAVHGGASEAGAGWVNGVLLLATVVTQLGVPAALRRFDHARVLGAGLVLLGAPAPAYLVSDGLPLTLALSAVRGAGFGILTVTSVVLLAELVPAERRGEAVGVYGFAVAVPNVVLLPASVAVAESWGFAVVFWVAALPVAGVPAALALGRTLRTRPHDAVSSSVRPDRRTVTAMLRPTAVLLVVTMAGGAMLTFAPQVVGSSSAVALLAMNLLATVSRWGAGTLSDRYGAGPFLASAVVIGAVGMGVCALAAVWSSGVALVAGGLALGVSYGAAQSLTLVVVFAKAGPGHGSTASAVWNAGFDAGTAAGAVFVGALASASSFQLGFVVVAVLLLAAVPLCRR